MDKRLRAILDMERRIELIRGRVQVGGSRAATQLVLGQLLAQASPGDLRELGGEGWQDAAQLALPLPPSRTPNFNHRQHYSLLQRLSLPIFDLLRESALCTYSRDIAVWLGDSALTPDTFVGYDAAMREYYLESPPLLAIEIIDSHNLSDELERLGIYEASGTPEVWWLEPEHQRVRQFVLQSGRYTLRTQRTGWLESAAVQGLALHLDDAWEPGWRPALTVTYRGKLSELSKPSTAPPQPPLQGGLTEAMRDELLRGVLGVLADLKNMPGRGGFKADLPFAPAPSFAPQTISFEQFISWAPEAKFEMMDTRLIVASERGNKELLGLLLLSAGLGEAFALLSDETKGALRGVN